MSSTLTARTRSYLACEPSFASASEQPDTVATWCRGDTELDVSTRACDLPGGDFQARLVAERLQQLHEDCPLGTVSERDEDRDSRRVVAIPNNSLPRGACGLHVAGVHPSAVDRTLLRAVGLLCSIQLTPFYSCRGDASRFRVGRCDLAPNSLAMHRRRRWKPGAVPSAACGVLCAGANSTRPGFGAPRLRPPAAAPRPSVDIPPGGLRPVAR